VHHLAVLSVTRRKSEALQRSPRAPYNHRLTSCRGPHPFGTAVAVLQSLRRRFSRLVGLAQRTEAKCRGPEREVVDSDANHARLEEHGDT
jgi:hypothetical protein